MGEKREGVVGNLEMCSPWWGRDGRHRILVVNTGELGGRVFTAAARAASSGGGAGQGAQGYALGAAQGKARRGTC
jgi:hypothetical protein